MKMFNNKRGIIWMPIIIVLLIGIVLIIIANLGSFTLFGRTFYIVSPQFSEELSFWWWVLLWIIIQIAVITAYVKFGIIIIKGINFSKSKFKIFMDYAKKIIHG